MTEYRTGAEAAQALGEKLVRYVAPVLEELEQALDVRLVLTALGLLQVILVLPMPRHPQSRRHVPFLVSLLVDHLLLATLLTNWCHRTGKRHSQAAVPLSRLRSAIARLWLAHHTLLLPIWLDSG